MLQRLTPEQITVFWDLVKESIRESLPPLADCSETTMSNILGSLLSGRMDCWVSYDKIEGKIKVNGIGTTAVIQDAWSGSKVLLIFSALALELTRPEEWAEGFNSLMKYAKAKECVGISAYVMEELLVKRAKQFGAITQTYLTFPINSVQNLNEDNEHKED
jgi:hypothetical protein